MDNPKPAKIPVKKSDGTTVFLTMEEFKEYKKKAAAPVVVFTPSPVEESKPKKLEPGKIEKVSLSVVQNTKTDLATVTPVKNIFVDEAAAKWKPADHASLLDADVTEEKKFLPTPNPAADNATAILAKVKEQFTVPIPKDIEGRFDSLVLSRIRDVRSVIDFEQYAKKSKIEGGLGFEEDQVGLLLAIIAAAQKIATSSAPLPPKADTRNDNKSPLQASGPRITPVMSPQSSKPPKPVTPFPLPKEGYSFAPPSKSQSTNSGAKPMVQDVVMPRERKQTMGPIDEIQYFSITDFRRLSPKTENAREIFKSKFQSLQEESYVFFLDARDAWHDSPLFHLYQETILSTLRDKKTLADAMAQKTDGLTQAEVDAIVEINHYLG